MAKVTLYRILEGLMPVTEEGEQALGLALIVEAYLANGWKLQGGPFLVDDHNSSDSHMYGQAITKRVKI